MATTAMAPVRRSHSVLARAVPLTFLLGATVVISWVGVRGTGITNGPGPWFHVTWFEVWLIQALLAFGLMVAVEWFSPSASGRAVLTAILAAWIGELIAAAIVLSLFIGELDVVHAPFIWLIATGFGIQPIAAILGGVLAGRRRAGPYG
jgi:hypothetical protein